MTVCRIWLLPLRGGLGEAVHAGLGSRVVGLAELATLAGFTDDILMMRPNLRSMIPIDDMAGAVEDGGEIGRDNCLPIVEAHLGEAAIAGDACIVDKNIYRA